MRDRRLQRSHGQARRAIAEVTIEAAAIVACRGQQQWAMRAVEGRCTSSRLLPEAKETRVAPARSLTRALKTSRSGQSGSRPQPFAVLAEAQKTHNICTMATNEYHGQTLQVSSDRNAVLENAASAYREQLVTVAIAMESIGTQQSYAAGTGALLAPCIVRSSATCLPSSPTFLLRSSLKLCASLLNLASPIFFLLSATTFTRSWADTALR